MKILLIGGPLFLGYHIIDSALALGHEVTTLNRGKTHADQFPQIEKLIGDRDGGLDVLKGRTWDVAIDTCGYIPRLVRDSARLLADAVEHYTFVSSISVYADHSVHNADETAAVGTIEDETVEEITGETYGPLKALCEQAAEKAMPGHVFNVRPGLIVGPRDPSDRFTYWPIRVARGGEVLAPDKPDVPTQVIDVRDLAEWIVRMAGERKTGVFNATGPAIPLTIGEVLQVCKAVSGSDARFTWASESFLVEKEVQPWMELPLWVPEQIHGMNKSDVSKAINNGLTFRPLEETVRDTLSWAKTRSMDHEWRAGIQAERELEILKMWQETNG